MWPIRRRNKGPHNYDRAALSMKGTQARTNFVYTDNSSFQPFCINPQDTLFNPPEVFPSTKNPMSENPINHPQTHQNEIFNDTCSQSSYGSSPNEDTILFFPNESDPNSWYLGCIVPESFLNPSNNATHINNNASSSKFPNYLEMEPNPENLNYLDYGFGGNEVAMDMNSCELSAIMDSPPVVENEWVENMYPYNGNMQALNSENYCSTSMPVFGDAVDFEYSLY